MSNADGDVAGANLCICSITFPTWRAIRSPTFTLAHVFCPHPPLIFGENGEDVQLRVSCRYTISRRGPSPRPIPRSGRLSREAYRDQAAFITERIEETIKQILARSPEPPIIILQSDHGSELKLDMNDVNNTDLKERMSILNAYYFPGQKYDGLYSGISPVNSFRVVLNTYFGSNLELLPDRSFFSTWPEPYHVHRRDRPRAVPDTDSVSLNR